LKKLSIFFLASNQKKVKMSVMIRIAFLFLTATLLANQPTSEQVSEAFGHLIAKKSIQTIGVDLDLNLVAKGMQDAAQGKESPLSESECIEALSFAQEEAFRKKSEDNLAAAEAFLKKNASQKNVVSLENGKLQYKIEKKGAGTEVTAESSPMIQYVGKHLDGSIFGQSDVEQTISLTETIPGFKKGLVGMKEGEKRTLYIHPEYGYGTSGLLPPNSLLTFEIEVVKAHVEPEPLTEGLILEGNQDRVDAPDLDAPQVR
jgi:peptidylprolyl isomerase